MNIFVELSANFYDALVGVMFVALFCKIKPERKWFLIPAVILVFGVSTFFTFHSAFSAFHSIIITIILFFVSFLLTNGKAVRKILSPILFEIVLLLNNTVFLASFCYIFNISLEALLTQSSVSRNLCLLFSKIILTIILLIILKFAAFNSNINITSLILYLASPILTAYILYVFMKMSLAFNLNEYAPFIVSGTIGIALMNTAAIFLFEYSNKNAEAKQRLEMIEKQTELEKESYQRMLKTNDQLRRMRHDIKNHLLYVRNVIENNEIEKAEKYIIDVENELEEIEKYMVSGNRMIDYILTEKLSEHKNITFVCTGSFAGLNKIDQLDLAVMFGNLIDNAIEAVENEDEKIIEIKLSNYINYCNIIISNPISESVLKVNPKLNTTKNNKIEHGWGLRSVRSIVDKYNGIFEAFEDHSKFNVHISLPIVNDEE